MTNQRSTTPPQPAPMTVRGEDGRIHLVSDLQRADNRRADVPLTPAVAVAARGNPD